MSLPLPTPTPFVGRDRLRRVLASVPPGSGTSWLLAGPAGVGKSRLAAQVALDLGWPALWGRCWDGGGAPPFWPWTQVARSLLGRPAGTDLAALVLDEAGDDRFALFDATVEVLHRHLAEQLAVIVLDDLHLADEPTLLLTRFVVQQIDRLPVLLVATSRPVAADDPVAPHLDALGRLGEVVTVGGLDLDEVDRLLAASSNTTELAAATVHAVTGGNPLYVEHVLRTGVAVADPLRAAVDRRLRDLPSAASRALAAVAVLGGPARLADVAAVADLPMATLDGPDGAVSVLEAAGVVRVDPTSRSVEVAHPLFAEAATDVGEPADHHRMHARAAELAHRSGRRSAHAHHLLRAGPDALAAAVAACRDAADEASGALAHEEAAGHLRRAIGALDRDRTATAFALHLELGRAHWRGSRRREADEAFDRAWDLACELDDPEALAEAALRGGAQYYFTGDEWQGVAERDRATLCRLDDDDSVLRARLLADLATKYVQSAVVDEGRELAAGALAMARRVADPYAIGHALVAEQVTALGPETLRRRIDSAREILTLARSHGIHDLEVHGRFLLMGALLEQGDIRGLDAELSAQRGVVDHLAEPRFARFALWFQGMRALLDGRPDDAEVVATECLELAQELGDADGFGVYAGQVGVARWMQGRVLEMEPLYVDLQRAEPEEPLWTGVLAWLFATHGRIDAARGQLATAPPIDDVMSGQHWLLTATTLAEAAAVVGDLERCEELRGALLPYRERVVPIAMGASSWAVVARPLGLATLALGRIDEGLRHLERAIDVSARLGARPWLIEAQLELAGALVDHGGGSDLDRVTRLLDEATREARVLGLRWFEERADGLRARIGTARSPGRSVPIADVDHDVRPRVAVLGAFEVTGTDGEVARWSSRKARELLKLLVAQRGAPVRREVAMDALWPGEPPERLGNRLSVALSTVRKALDPARERPVGDLVEADTTVLRLRLDNVDVDVERFLEEVGRVDDDVDALRRVLDTARGDAFPDEPYAEWAQPLRAEVRAATSTLARRLAAAAEAVGDDLSVVEGLRRLLELDPYDEHAHLGMVRALTSMGAHGQAQAAYERYRARAEELGLEV